MVEIAPASLTHARVLKIAVPIVLANATVPILGLVDTAVIGQLGQAAPIGAVGIGATILTAFYWIFGFLRMGTTGFASQAIGQGDRAEAAVILTRALMGCLFGGLILILLQVPLFTLAFAVAPASDAVETLAVDYMMIRVWSAPALISIYALTGWLIALERTREVLIIQLAMNGLNIGLDFLFVLGFDWGVEGVAWATFIAEWGGAVLGLWFCRAAFAGPDWRNWAQVFRADKLKRFAQVNSDILIRSLLLQAIFLGFVFFSAGFGDVPLAANHILLQFLSLMAYAMDGFAFAVETLVGQALGARKRAALRRAALLCSFWGLVVGVVIGLAFGLFGGAIIDLMTTAPGVRAEARLYLPYLVLTPILAVAPFMLDGIFIGATRTADMRNMMIVSAAVYGLSVAVLMPPLGNHGLWIALSISFVIRGITLGLRYPALEAEADLPRPVQ